MAEPVSRNSGDDQRNKSVPVGHGVSQDQDNRNRQEAHRDYYTGDVLDVRCPFCRRAAQLIIRNGHAKWLVELE